MHCYLSGIGRCNLPYEVVRIAKEVKNSTLGLNFSIKTIVFIIKLCHVELLIRRIEIPCFVAFFLLLYDF